MAQVEGMSAIVLAWQEAANQQAVDQLLELSHPQIELVGPRGSGYGHPVLQDWLKRAGLSLETRRVFARGNTVVVAQHAVWRSPETGEVIGVQDLASRFRVDGGQVTQVARVSSLAEALEQAGLSEADEVLV